MSAFHPIESDVADRDLAAIGIVQSQEQIDDGGLAASGGPDQRDRLSRMDLEIDSVQDRNFSVVQRHVLEGDRSIEFLRMTGNFGC